MLLERGGLHAIVLDRARFPRDKPCGEGLMPSGAAVLAELGVDLAAEGFPPVRGVRYRLPDGAAAFGAFRQPGFGVRRLRLDAMLAERAGASCGGTATALRPARGGAAVETSSGALRARAGAGPARAAPALVAAGRVCLAGDSAGFWGPLPGEAMAAGLAQARALAGFLADDLDSAAQRYRRWHRTQWRRRRLVGGLALALTGSDRLARRALAGVSRRPVALERLLEVNDGSRSVATVHPRDWMALAGF